MNRNSSAVRVGLALALAQACTPQSAAPQRSLAVRALVDLEAKTQVTRIGVYALRLAADGTVRSSWGNEVVAQSDGPYAAAVDSWPELDVLRGDRVHVTVVAYGPDSAAQERALAAREVDVQVGDPQWLRIELDWPDFGNVIDDEPTLRLPQASQPAPLAFDPRERFTVKPTTVATPSPLSSEDLPEEQCVDVEPCFASGEPPRSECYDGCEASSLELTSGTVSTRELRRGACALLLPPQTPVDSTPVLVLRDAALGTPEMELQGTIVARLGRDYELGEGGLTLTADLCARRGAAAVSVACHATAENAPAVCRASATRRPPQQQGSRFVLPNRPNLSFGEVQLSAPPTLFAVAEGAPRLFAIANPEQLVVRYASRYYEGLDWRPPTYTGFAADIRIRALHAVGARGPAPARLYVAGTDGKVHGFDGASWDPSVSFCAGDATCTDQADVVGVVSATALHEAIWVLREPSALAVYREREPLRAERITAPGDVSRVLEPIDYGPGVALIVQRASGAWELLALDTGTGTTTVLPIETDERLLHLVQSPSTRPDEDEPPHVLTETGEWRLQIAADAVTLVPVRALPAAGATWYGRGNVAWSGNGEREACSLHDKQLRCWWPEYETTLLEGVFAVTYSGQNRAAVIAGGGPGSYTLDLRYYGPSFP